VEVLLATAASSAPLTAACMRQDVVPVSHEA
jgi:hypothetical protein